MVGCLARELASGGVGALKGPFWALALTEQLRERRGWVGRGWLDQGVGEAGTHGGRWHQNAHTVFESGDAESSQLSGKEKGRDRNGWQLFQSSAPPRSLTPAKALPLWWDCLPPIHLTLPLLYGRTYFPFRLLELLKAKILEKGFLKVT